MAAALSWDEICERAMQNNKTVICEVEKRGKHRLFKVKCNICKYDIVKTIDDFKSCKYCSGNNKLTKEEFVKKARQVHEQKYNYDLVDYINNLTKIKILCNSCGNIFEQAPNNHLSGSRCNICSKNQKKSRMQFIQSCIELHEQKYNYDLVDYINNLTRVKILCNSCGNVFNQVPKRLLKGHGCKCYSESKGEIRIAKYLSSKNIKFTKNKIFKTLKHKSYLKPDFYLEDLILLIEYDGEGHYEACFGSTVEEKQKNLEDCQLRDKLKTEWAKANNIPLLRIPYWDFDRIEELIEAFIIQHTKKKEIKQLVLEI